MASLIEQGYRIVSVLQSDTTFGDNGKHARTKA